MPDDVSHIVQVTSAGGAGTSALLYHLHMAGLPLPRTPDWMPYKHQLRPPEPEEVPAGFRAIFMLADPRDAVVSLFRRGFQLDHPNLPEDRSRFDAFRLRRLRWWILGRRDLFAMDEQLDNWLGARIPVLFVGHPSVGTRWDVVARFIGHPDLPPPQWRPRRSNWDEEHPILRAGLDRIHRPLADRIASLPPVSVNRAGRALLGGDLPSVPTLDGSGSEAAGV